MSLNSVQFGKDVINQFECYLLSTFRVADRVRDFYVPEWLTPLPEWLEDGANIPAGFFGD